MEATMKQEKKDTAVEWQQLPLGQVFKPNRPRVSPAEKPELPFIGMEHVEAHTMKLLGTVPAETMKSSTVHFQPGDVLYGRLRPYLNKVYRPDFEGLCSAEFIVFPETEGVDNRYLQYFLNSNDFVSFATGLNEGDRPRVDFKQISPYTFPLAPLPEQRRIVSAIETQLGRLDAAVARLHAAKARLKRYKQAVLKAAYSEVDWPIYTTSDVTELITDGDHQAPPQVPSGVPFIVISSVKNNAIDFSTTKYVPESYYAEITEKRKPRRGDVLYTVTGSYGIPVLVDHDAPFCFQRHIALLRPNALILPAYLFSWLQTPEAMAQAKQYATGTAQMTVSLKGLRSFELPVPPIKAQKRIVREVEERLGSIAAMESTLDAQLLQSTRLRQAVFKRAFEGRLA